LLRRIYGPGVYRRYWLARRPVAHLIEEARTMLDFNTREVSFEDDDILGPPESEQWLEEFAPAWKQEIGLLMYANVCPLTINKASDRSLELLSELLTSVQMGVQAARPQSLELFNRSLQNEQRVRAAYQRLVSVGLRVKLEVIVGLPVEDPLDDAIDTIKMCQRAAPGTFIACFPLMLYPGTSLYKRCRRLGIPLNDHCEYEWHSGEGSVKFDPLTQKRIRNLTKMATMFVKYNLDENWMRAIVYNNKL